MASDSDDDLIIGSGGAPLADDDGIVAAPMPRVKRYRSAAALSVTGFFMF